MTEYIVDVTGLESGDYAIAREPIVRCRDCRHFNGWACKKSSCSYCGEPQRVEPDRYCAWGEKASNFTTCKCGEDIETHGCEWVVCPSCGRVITE